MNATRVKNTNVWHSLKILFTGALLLFLINIYFGFDNALTLGDIPRWQVLLHLHGGSIGWITLSAIGIAIWVLTGDREVDADYEKKVRNLVWSAVLVFAAYVPQFGIAFSRTTVDDPLRFLLPVFGTAAVIVLWWSAIFSLGQLRELAAATTVQYLASGALLVAAIGATVGALLGLELAMGIQFLPIAGDDRVAPHAGMMDTYLFLVAAAIVEWFTQKDPYQPASKAGKAQAIIWAIGAALVPFAFFLNIVDVILPIFMLTLLTGVIIFLIRAGWGAIRNGPFSEGVKPWAFFGAMWLVIYMGLFLYLISVFVGTPAGANPDIPAWFFVLFVHAGFVGMMTTLILSVIMVYTWDARDTLAWGDKTALWLIHGGIVLFVLVKATSDSRLGAIVMGVGVLLGVYTLLQRLRSN